MGNIYIYIFGRLCKVFLEFGEGSFGRERDEERGKFCTLFHSISFSNVFRNCIFFFMLSFKGDSKPWTQSVVHLYLILHICYLFGLVPLWKQDRLNIILGTYPLCFHHPGHLHWTCASLAKSLSISSSQPPSFLLFLESQPRWVSFLAPKLGWPVDRVNS